MVSYQLAWRQGLTRILDCSRRRVLVAPRRSGFLLRPILSWILIAHLAATADAINIVIQLQDEGENPSYDYDGSRLAAIFNAAAAYWEDYLPEAGETGTYEVDVTWSFSEFEDEEDPAIARWVFETGGDNNIYVNPNPTANGQPKQWYFDLAPFDHSEYDFVTQDRDFFNNRWNYRGGQWLYRDVDPVEKNSWFTGSPPDVMEIGYRGRALDPMLQDQYDLLSSVMHELGHELGVNETGGPWGASSVWLRSGSAGIAEDADSGHLLARTSLMCEGCGLLGTRRLPSAVDIMAVADDEDMATFDLPRRDYVGSGEWSHPLLFANYGWMGGIPPDADVDAFLRSDNLVTLNENAAAKSLLVDQSSDLHTGAFTLTVGEQTTIGGGSGASFVWIESGGELVTANAWVAGGLFVQPGGMLEVQSQLFIPSTGQLRLTGAIAEVGQVFIQDPLDPFLTGGLLSGSGTVDASGILVNDGKISASGGALLFLSTTNSALWNLDGSTGAGTIDAIAGDLIFLGPHLTFDSIVTVGSGRSFTVNTMWNLGEAGRLNLIGDVNLPATIHGFAGAGHAIIAGRVLVDILGVIDIAVTFESTATVFANDNNDVLRLLQSTYYEGGSFTGNGVIEQIGSAAVERDTAIDVRIYDWDGSESGPSTTSIDPEVVFTLNSLNIEPTSGDGHDGTINVNGGILEVNTKAAAHGGGFVPSPWQLDRLGRLNLKNGGLVAEPPTEGPGAVVRGSPLVVEGEVLAIGEGNRIEADTTFKADSSVQLYDRASELFLAGATKFFGGSYTGDGILHQQGHAGVEDNTPISVAIYDWDGLETASSNTIVAPGVQFTLNVGALETSASDGHDGVITLRNGSSLNVNTPAAWRVDGEMQLENAAVNGSPLVNFGAISGTGAINANLTNHGTISPGLSPGTLLINADYDQQAEGTLQVELAGLTAGEFDLLRVMDDANLDGTLLVTLLNGFEPVLGSSFSILSTDLGNIVGNFAAEILPYFNGRTFDVIYNPTSVVLQVIEAVAIPGDYNNNGTVDAADYVVWRKNEGTNNMLPNDPIGGTIGTGQYDQWRAHFGQTAAGGSAAGSAAAVPEPSSAWLLFLAAATAAIHVALTSRQSR